MGLFRGNKSKTPSPRLGYKTGFADAYELGNVLGAGGGGTVFHARQKTTDRQVAVKSIPKVLNDFNASERKKADQIPYLKREIEVMLALRGTLNIANLEAVYEDDTHVHLVMELCSGGELLARTKVGRHYSERTAASFLRAVLRTVVQCHARRIIHRDVKPDNFLLLTKEDDSPIKAIDFGLAVFYDPAQLPVAGLNPEGTPWYLAPECCRAKWYPASDVWAVGVMACYLLTGAYPFLDRVSPNMPDLARTLRSICFEELDLSRKEFEDLSDDARAFIAALLVKDPLQRPSADDALRHPFLRGSKGERSAGKPLDRTVVQRIQRFAQSSLFKRTVLEHIAADLVSMHFDPEPSTHGAAVFYERSVRGGRAYAAAAADRSVRGGSAYDERSRHGDRSFRGLAVAALAAVRLDRSVRGGDQSFRGGSASGLRPGQTLAAASSAAEERSVRGGAGGGDRSYQEDHSSRGDRSSGVGGTTSRAAAKLDRSVRSGEDSTRGRASLDRSVRGGLRSLSRPGSARDGSVRSAGIFLPVATPYSHRLAQLFDQLHFEPGQKIDRGKLREALGQVGYHLAEGEVEELFDVVDVEQRGEVTQAELAAGLIDWKAFQDTYKDRWLECARRAFAELADGKEELGAAEIAAAFSGHLSQYEVDAAVHQALLEATSKDALAPKQAVTPAASGEAEHEGSAALKRLSFDHFLALLRAPSIDLEIFEDRLGNHISRQASLQGDERPPVLQHQKPGSACCTIS